VTVSNVKMVEFVGILGVLLFATVQLDGPARIARTTLMTVVAVLAPNLGSASIMAPHPIIVNVQKAGGAKIVIPQTAAKK
jgi:hypothetical protein